jgi:hypothetical protein
MPSLVQQRDAWPSTSPNGTGIIIPIRKPIETFKSDSIRIKSGAGRAFIEALVQLAPHEMIVLNSEVRFKVPGRVAYQLVLHPISSVLKVEPVAERL